MENTKITPLNFTTEADFVAACVVAATNQAKQVWAESESSRRLVNLHTELGFSSSAELIAALKKLDASVPAAKRRKRTVVTPELRDKARALNASGKKQKAIALELGISAPTVAKLIK